MFKDFQRPKPEPIPRITLSWHRCNHPKGITACKGNHGCDKGEEVK